MTNAGKNAVNRGYFGRKYRITRNFLVLKSGKGKTFVCLKGVVVSVMDHPRMSKVMQRRAMGQSGQAGYVPQFPLLYRAYNLVIAAVLSLALAPLIMSFALILRFTQGPGVIARSPRLGVGRIPFDLYRFATDPAENPVGFSGATFRPTRLGRYLRQSGLDALPQLFNVLKGDMNILGPQPMRAAIAQIEEARDPLYAIRFQVKPGMSGYTQAMMGAGASARVRGKLTYRLCRTNVNFLSELRLIAKIGVSTLRNMLRQVFGPSTQKGHLMRARRKAQDLHIQLETENGSYPVYALSQGLLTTPHVVTGGPARLVFGAGNGIRKARVELGRLSHLQGETVFHYLPAHENAGHLISRYLREEAIIQPPRPKWQRPRLSDLQFEIDLHTARETVPADADRR
ncbi:MAG: sugar transferase [Pseudomonadota bacterium]